MCNCSLLLSGITVCADESDAIWSSQITDPAAERHDLRSQREAQMYELLGSATTGDQKPLSPGSRVRTFVQVSMAADCINLCNNTRGTVLWVVAATGLLVLSRADACIWGPHLC